MENNNYKIGILFDDNISEWKSCNSILANLVESYQLTRFIVDKITMSTVMTQKDLEKLALNIINKNYSHLIFADYRTIPGLLLREIVNLTHKRPIIFIHIYGDFFLNRNHWLKSESTLKHFNIKFLCASTAQSGFFNNFSDKNQISPVVFTVPFSVSDDFSFSDKKRILGRRNFSLQSDDFCICYSGRISMQKNVLELISFFSTLINFLPNAKLMIAGPFDDIGLPYIGLGRLPLTMEHEFYSLIDNLPINVRNNIFYCGNLQTEELLEFYNAADTYISFSTHNDEDFGMAPAEALSCGLPLILTNWGGFADFKKNMPANVDLINIDILGQKITPTASAKQMIVKKLFRKKSLTSLERHMLSHNTKAYYSQQAIAVQLTNHILKDSERFRGFNELFMTTVLQTQKLGPFQNKNNSFNDLYLELYDSYFNKGKE